MAKATTPGTCSLCKKDFPKGSMTRHLTKCLEAHEESHKDSKAKQQQLYRLVVEGKYNPQYWLHLEAPATSKFADVDDFLRNIWLECCGHMSAFRVEGLKPKGRNPGLGALLMMGMDERDPDEVDMGSKLSQVLTKDMKLTHDYDFGSTTTLAIKVVGEREGHPVTKKPVVLLARNRQPQILCGRCGKNLAEFIDIHEQDEGSWYCSECAEEEDLPTEEEVLPVVNSPRVGVCAYTG